MNIKYEKKMMVLNDVYNCYLNVGIPNLDGDKHNWCLSKQPLHHQNKQNKFKDRREYQVSSIIIIKDPT